MDVLFSKIQPLTTQRVSHCAQHVNPAHFGLSATSSGVLEQTGCLRQQVTTGSKMAMSPTQQDPGKCSGWQKKVVIEGVRRGRKSPLPKLAIASLFPPVSLAVSSKFQLFRAVS